VHRAAETTDSIGIPPISYPEGRPGSHFALPPPVRSAAAAHPTASLPSSSDGEETSSIVGDSSSSSDGEGLFQFPDDEDLHQIITVPHHRHAPPSPGQHDNDNDHEQQQQRQQQQQWLPASAASASASFASSAAAAAAGLRNHSRELPAMAHVDPLSHLLSRQGSFGFGHLTDDGFCVPDAAGVVECR